ncbi:MAG: serine hydrolase, partial [Thermacetogeniaceae bacterium]
MRKRLIARRAVCLIAILLLAFNVEVANQGTAWAQGSDPLKIQAKAVVLLDEGSGRVLYSKNPSERLPIASLTKIMTALLVLENGDLDQKVYISRRAAETGESTIWLEPGEIFSRKELLYALLLSSANDAATALSESLAGTEDNFVAMMNRRGQELQLGDTHFSNAHGLDAPDHYSSAYDLAVLSRQAMANSFFEQVVATKTTTLPWVGHPWPRFLINKNRLLFRYSGANGIKTGYTKK